MFFQLVAGDVMRAGRQLDHDTALAYLRRLDRLGCGTGVCEVAVVDQTALVGDAQDGSTAGFHHDDVGGRGVCIGHGISRHRGEPPPRARVTSRGVSFGVRDPPQRRRPAGARGIDRARLTQHGADTGNLAAGQHLLVVVPALLADARGPLAEKLRESVTDGLGQRFDRHRRQCARRVGHPRQVSVTSLA
ncbi:hypothetical protein [Mycobacteroides abscessus]|uniref:hypothetical protein n=1 Tax=Mycobacteroides abscessus TaxID=36809 RepID=UPI00266EA205|nr:hypothetical protein [Mycobacteroides abscessus]MDO3110433.1 hypothetical protein [Mycobacteroides abscessus subsp. abscessus]